MRNLRAWDDQLQKMLYAKIEQFDDSLNYRFEQHFETDKPIYQWSTGLKDKNGVGIYEGDIIKVNKLTFESSSVLPENLNVEFYGGMFQLFRNDEPLMGLHLMYIEDGEVIGNIYDHKHLLNLPGEVDHDTN